MVKCITEEIYNRAKIKQQSLYLERATSVYINDQNGTLGGSIYMNFDVTELIFAQKSLSSLANIGDKESQMEFFTDNIDELLDLLLNEYVNKLCKNVNHS